MVVLTPNSLSRQTHLIFSTGNLRAAILNILFEWRKRVEIYVVGRIGFAAAIEACDSGKLDVAAHIVPALERQALFFEPIRLLTLNSPSFIWTIFYAMSSSALGFLLKGK